MRRGSLTANLLAVVKLHPIVLNEHNDLSTVATPGAPRHGDHKCWKETTRVRLPKIPAVEVDVLKQSTMCNGVAQNDKEDTNFSQFLSEQGPKTLPSVAAAVGLCDDATCCVESTVNRSDQRDR